LIECSK